MGYPSPSCMIGHDQKTEHGQQQDWETSRVKAADYIVSLLVSQMAAGIRTSIFRESIRNTRGQSTLCRPCSVGRPTNVHT